MKCFDDFDAWGDAVSGASLRLACDGVEVRRWSLGLAHLGPVALQLAFEGGGNICYGGNSHTGTMLFLPLTHATGHVVNGETLDDHSLFVIPRHADFQIHVRRRAHSWCSIALPFDVTQPACRVAREPAAVGRLKQLVGGIGATLLDQPSDTAAHEAAGRALAAAAAACLTPLAETCRVIGRPRLDRATIVRNAMAILDAATIMPTTTELARQLDVTSRTLLRTFREVLGVPPKQYLLLRELHLVRRALRAASPHETTVADVLTRHGIWEFGRFAARYRRQFDELPSETLTGSRVHSP